MMTDIERDPFIGKAVAVDDDPDIGISISPLRAPQTRATRARQPIAPASSCSGEALRAWRERMGLNKLRACRAIGCSRPALDRWESGLMVIPLYISLAATAIEAALDPIG